jgi:hypothetical protein
MIQNGAEFWAAVGAVGQIVTAIMAIFVACIAFRFTKRQTSITLLTSLNNLWNSYHLAMIENPEAREVVDKYRETIISPLEDSIADMTLNIYETSFLLHENRLISREYYDAMIVNVLDGVGTIPEVALKKYLRRGYHLRFVADVEARLPRHNQAG